MKVLSKAKAIKARDRERILDEIHLMTRLPPSPFLQRCHDAFESPSRIFMIVDYIAMGDLFSHLATRLERNQAGFTEDEARILLAEVALGLEHLHSHGYVHRDIKVL